MDLLVRPAIDRLSRNRKPLATHRVRSRHGARNLRGRWKPEAHLIGSSAVRESARTCSHMVTCDKERRRSWQKNRGEAHRLDRQQRANKAVARAVTMDDPVIEHRSLVRTLIGEECCLFVQGLLLAIQLGELFSIPGKAVSRSI
ncbi:hypothetical protein CCMA1212_001175 [Trichoderma ghanense]|uniref:Uncharacterized protein n=1 Tax=Trichoderma ghanense TaxID=65468 RepID=A0ABY2HHF8_9HYPO